jgi:hypothetical protein
MQIQQMLFPLPQALNAMETIVLDHVVIDANGLID